MATSTVGQLAWHVHHTRLMERLTEPIEVRQEFIRRCKPASEREVRLRLLKLVKGSLPPAVERAWVTRAKAEATWEKVIAAYNKAEMAYITRGEGDHKKEASDLTKARAAWGKAEAAVRAGPVYVTVLKEHAAEIDALHQKECPNCPWNSRTIFPEKREV